MRLTTSQIYQICLQVGFDPEAAKIATAIALQESGGRTNAYNPGTATIPEQSIGIFQINMNPSLKRDGRINRAKLADPYYNAEIAFQMSNGGKNWRPWTTFTRGMYKARMAEVNTVAAQPAQAPPARSTAWPAVGNASNGAAPANGKVVGATGAVAVEGDQPMATPAAAATSTKVILPGGIDAQRGSA
jgi:hypothetical protein